MGVTVCVAEGFPLLLEALEERLGQDERIDVVGACGSGRELVELVRTHRPDVALVDLQLADADGAALISQLQREQPTLRTVALTGSDGLGIAHVVLQAGASGCLVKRQGVEQVADALVAAADGGTVIAPQLAGGLIGASDDSALGDRYMPSPSDLQLLRMLVQGETDDTIARQMFVSTRTVQNHLARIRARAGVRRRAELACWAVEQSLV